MTFDIQLTHKVKESQRQKKRRIKMKMSDLVAEYILKMLDESDGNAEIQRNELAGILGCVPSQINYVITSRFTPEQGYIVESRRGGGGYIRITRVAADRRVALMHIVNSIGDRISSAASQAILGNMSVQGLISEYDRILMSSALSDNVYSSVPQEQRDILRASIMKNMLITLVILQN